MEDPYEVLGLAPHATWAEVRAARRRLAKAWHPDLHQGRGVDAERRMAVVNRAFEQLRAARTQGAPAPAAPAAAPEGSATFSMEALQVVAFEAVLLAAIDLGDVVHVEEPYLLGVLLDEPGPCDCLVELSPEAGGSLVSLDVAPRHFGECPSASAVRDAFLARLGRPVPG